MSTSDENQALELLHFGFRGVVRRADALLQRRRLGRVHHRILYFVGRNPHLAVGELLRILGISKQALNAPLRQLIQRKLVKATVDPDSRRRKLLSLTTGGARFENQLSGMQRRQFARAFGRAGAAASRGWRRVMELLAADLSPAPRG